jgi:hypothetical protein
LSAQEGKGTKLENAKLGVQQAEERLALLSKKSIERKQMEKQENENAASLRRWCVRVRSFVLVPSLQTVAEEARPRPMGALSTPMLSLISDADILGIAGLPDVDAMVNYFNCMSWSLFALSIIRRRTSYEEMDSLLSHASGLKLPDEKAVRTMKIMVQRASQWQGKVRKTLAPKPGLTKPLNLDLLKDLMAGVEEIALRIPEANKLKIAIADKGARHCLCGGPSDGRIMLCCDKCELWFHGTCMQVTKESSHNLKKWNCPSCSGVTLSQLPPLVSVEGEETLSCEETSSEPFGLTEEYDYSPHAPDPENLWPPFALLGSETAAEILGGECSAIPDETEWSLVVEQVKIPSVLSNSGKEVSGRGKSGMAVDGSEIAPVVLSSTAASSATHKCPTIIISATSTSLTLMSDKVTRAVIFEHPLAKPGDIPDWKIPDEMPIRASETQSDVGGGVKDALPIGKFMKETEASLSAPSSECEPMDVVASKPETRGLEGDSGKADGKPTETAIEGSNAVIDGEGASSERRTETVAMETSDIGKKDGLAEIETKASTSDGHEMENGVHIQDCKDAVAGNDKKGVNEVSDTNSERENKCGETEYAAVSLTECQPMDIDDYIENVEEVEHAEGRAGNSASTMTSIVNTQDQEEGVGAEKPGDGSFSECRSMDVEYSSHNEDKATENQKVASIEGTREISAISTTCKSEVPRSEPHGSIRELESATLEPVADSIQQTTGSTQPAHAEEEDASVSGFEAVNSTEQSAEIHKLASDGCSKDTKTSPSINQTDSTLEETPNESANGKGSKEEADVGANKAVSPFTAVLCSTQGNEGCNQGAQLDKNVRVTPSLSDSTVNDIDFNMHQELQENGDHNGPSMEMTSTQLRVDSPSERDFSASLQANDRTCCFEGSEAITETEGLHEDAQGLAHVLPDMRVALKEASA